MAITSSTIVEDLAQIDGRRSIRERHVDTQGTVYFVIYIAAAGLDAQAQMTSRVALLTAMLKQHEIDREINKALQDGPAVMPVLNWNTNTEFGLALREVYKLSSQRDACRLGWWVTQFNLTDNQLRTFFGLTAGQVTAARTLLDSLSSQYISLLSAAGA